MQAGEVPRLCVKRESIEHGRSDLLIRDALAVGWLAQHTPAIWPSLRYIDYMSASSFRIGLISDTHNMLRPAAKLALAGVDRILHAGDICGRDVLDELAAVAPVTAVRGNNDRGRWAGSLQTTAAVEVGGVSIYMLHDLNELDLDPGAAGFRVVISGHSHRPVIRETDGVLFVNPGSAGPRRFSLPVSLGFIEIVRGQASASLRTLE